MRKLEDHKADGPIMPASMLTFDPHQDTSNLLIDTLYLLRGEKSGHMAQYGFRSPKYEGDPSGGLVHWEENVRNRDFPANLESKTITNPDNIAKIMDPIERQSRHVSFIEVGCGLYESVKTKTVPLIQHFLRANGEGSRRKAQYIAIDTADALAAEAAFHIKNDIPELSTESHQLDYTQLESRIFTEGHPPVAILWGGTLWNTPSVKGIDTNQMIASQLTSLGKMIGVGGYVVVSHYWIPDDSIEKKLAPYETETNKAAVKSILHAIQQDVEPSFDPESFDIKIEYNKASRVITMSAESKIDQVITLSAVGNFKRALKAGERLTLVNSHKQDYRDIEDIARKADFKVVEDIRDDQTNTGIVLLVNRGPH